MQYNDRRSHKVQVNEIGTLIHVLVLVLYKNDTHTVVATPFRVGEPLEVLGDVERVAPKRMTSGTRRKFGSSARILVITE